MAYNKNVRYNGDDTQMAKLRGGVEERSMKEWDPQDQSDYMDGENYSKRKGQEAVERQKKIKAARKRRKAKRMEMEKKMKK